MASGPGPDPADALPRVSFGANVTLFERRYPLVRVSAGTGGFGYLARNRRTGNVMAEGLTLDELAWQMNQRPP